MELILNDLQSGYVALVKQLLDYGQPVMVRDQLTTEITAATLIFPYPDSIMLPVGTGRAINLKLATVEALQLVAGESRGDLVLKAAPEFVNVLVDPTDLDYGAYGPRLAGQLAEVVALLRRDPTSRQGIATIWHQGDLTHVGDRPCTIFMHFMIRNHRLELHTHMRSNDVWLGTPYDVFAFTQLQLTMARALQREPGQYVHHATSLHLYDRNRERAGQLTFPAQTNVTVADGGVRASAGDAPTTWSRLRMEAHSLLVGTGNPTVNPWYAGQMERLLR